MKKILVLTDDDFTNPQEAQQHFYKGLLKNGENIALLEQEFHQIVLNGKYVTNRFGTLSDEPRL